MNPQHSESGISAILKVSMLCYSVSVLLLAEPQAAAQLAMVADLRGAAPSWSLDFVASQACTPDLRVCRLWKAQRPPCVPLRLVCSGVRDWRVRGGGAGTECTRSRGGCRQGLGARHPGELFAPQGGHSGVCHREPKRWRCSASCVVTSQGTARPASAAHSWGRLR
jgi:hypothetical protein